MRTWLPVTAAVLLLAGCTAPPRALLTEDEALDAVWAEPYVAETSAGIAKLGRPDLRAVVMYQGQFERESTAFFQFQFVESHPDHLATIAWIAVNRRTGEVLFEDTAGDCQWLPSNEWLKRIAAQSADAR
jgi:hypothetical protein